MSRLICFVILVLGCGMSQRTDAAGVSALRLEPTSAADGVRLYDGQRWGVVQSVVSNAGSTDVEGLLTVGVGSDDGVEFGRQIWLPGNSRRVIQTLIRPADDQRGVTFGVWTRLAQNDDGRDLPVDQRSSQILRRTSSVETALLVDGEDPWPRVLVEALRQSAGVGNGITTVAPTNAPPASQGYDVIDAMFIASTCHGMDPMQLAAIREWLMRGGRLWIMLDRTGFAWPGRLLGNDWLVTSLGEIGLDDYEINGPSGVEARQHDYPVSWLRVSASGFDVTHSIDGYPVLMQKRVGRGTLVVSTLGAEGWVNEARQATGTLDDLAWFVGRTNRQQAAGGNNQDVLEIYLRELIAYEVLGRRSVVAVLGALTLGVLGSGVWLWRRRRLEWLGAISGIGAVAGTGGLVVLGFARQGDAPTTAASVTLTQLTDDQPYADTNGVTGVYVARQDISAGRSLTFGQGELVWPDSVRRATGAVQLIWNDPARLSVKRTSVPAGSVQKLRLSDMMTLSSPLRAIIELGVDGMVGSVSLPDGLVLEDAVIASPAGRVAVQVDASGRLTATMEDVLGPGEYLRGGLLGRKRAARQEVYRTLMEDPLFPPSLSLLGWIERQTSVTAADGSSIPRTDESLFVIPLEVDRPQTGGRVTVPAVMLSMRPYRGPIKGGFESSTIYNIETGEWLADVSEPMLVLMEYELPEGVASLAIESATLTFDLRAPGRRWQVATLDGDRLRLMPGGSDAAGRTQVELAGGDVVEVRPGGRVVVGIEVGAFGDPRRNRPWSLNGMSLSVTGVAP